MGTEGQMWDYMRPRLAPFGRVVRVENTAGPGTPDLYYRFRVGSKFNGWIELKHLDRPPVGEGTKIYHEDLTLDQVLWLEDEYSMGGRAHLLLRCGRAFTLMNVMTVRRFYQRELTYTALKLEADYHCNTYFKPAELLQCLRGF